MRFREGLNGKKFTPTVRFFSENCTLGLHILATLFKSRELNVGLVLNDVSVSCEFLVYMPSKTRDFSLFACQTRHVNFRSLL